MHVLAVGAHPDDIELGCGGTLAAHSAAGDEVTMLVMTDGQSGPGAVAERIIEQVQACKTLEADLVWGNLPDGFISNHERTALQIIERALHQTGATRLYTHGADDSHQDHRAIALLSFGAARNLSEILSYDSPSSRHFAANLFVDITDTLPRKVASLVCHDSQVGASNRVDVDLVRAQARYRGGLVRVGAAEAFMVERLVLRLTKPTVIDLASTSVPADQEAPSDAR